jgi:ribosomal protein S18 acetylase RimI-like enzyme
MEAWISSLRPARLSDAADLHRYCFPDQPAEQTGDYLNWSLTQMQKGRMLRLVAEVDGQVIASAQLAIHRRRGEIGSLVVAPAYRRLGIGNALLQVLIREARARGVRTLDIAARTDMPWIQAWYRRRGFAPYRERTMPGGEHIVELRLSP